jgi:hypothetical protein
MYSISVTPAREDEVLNHENVWESGFIDPPLLTSAINGGEWSDLLLRKEHLVPMDAVEKRKINFHYWDSNPSPPSYSPSLYRLSYSDVNT